MAGEQKRRALSHSGFRPSGDEVVKGPFLVLPELKRLQKFRAKAQDNRWTALTINRKMMAPIAK